MKIFKPEQLIGACDLESLNLQHMQSMSDLAKTVAERANQILTDYVKTLPEVWGLNDNHVGWLWDEKKRRCDTHSARLIDLRNIETEKE